MRVEDFKRWHWIAIGLLVGLGLAYFRAEYPSHPTYTIRHGISVRQFAQLAEGRFEGERTGGGLLDRLAAMAKPAVKHPTLVDVVIHPPVDGKQYVTGRFLRRVTPSGPMYDDFELSAPVPFVVPGQPVPDKADFSVRDFLAVKAPQIEYQYLWWKAPSIEPAIWGGAAAVLIGGLWPLLLNLLIGAGFGRGATPDEPEYDLDRFGHENSDRPPAPPAVTEEDRLRLKALEAEMERALASGSEAASSTAAAALSTEQAPAIAALSNAPLDAPLPDGSEDPKEYRGEYYPVAHPLSNRRPAQN